MNLLMFHVIIEQKKNKCTSLSLRLKKKQVNYPYYSQLQMTPMLLVSQITWQLLFIQVFQGQLPLLWQYLPSQDSYVTVTASGSVAVSDPSAFKYGLGIVM